MIATLRASAGARMERLMVLGMVWGSIYRVDIADGRVEKLFDKGGTVPDGVVVENGVIYWTTMGEPTKDPSAPDGGLDFSARNGGVHAV